jgi:DNA processing protein
MLGVGREGPRTDRAEIGLERGRPEGASTGRVPGAEETQALRDERRAHAVLAAVTGLGPVTLGDLLRRVGPPGRVIQLADRDGGRPLAEALAASSTAAGEPGQPIGRQLVGRIVEAVAKREGLLAKIDALGLALVTVDDPSYPSRLRAIEMPPPVLYVRGDPAALDRARSVAVVGTRRPSEPGRRTASRIAGSLARAGATVVSGLAVGIDGAAHAAAIAEGGATVAVLGGGHARIYPRAHERLAARIAAEGGAVISELPPDTEPAAGTFPRRNRIISGLADATVVVEAAARSGALITAGWALEQGRGCFLVPGSLDAPMSAGCLAFLREWSGEARIVAGVGELLEDLGLNESVAESRSTGRAPGASVLGELGPAERRVALALLDGCVTADEIVAQASLSIGAVLGTLTLLEVRGLVAGSYGRYLPVGRLASAPPPRRGSSARRSPRGALPRVAGPSGPVLP